MNIHCLKMLSSPVFILCILIVSLSCSRNGGNENTTGNENTMGNENTTGNENTNESLQVTYDLATQTITGINPDLEGRINLTIPSTIEGVAMTTIADGAFMDNDSIQRLVIENGIKTIGDRAFRGCSNLATTLKIPNSVITIGEEAFEACQIRRLVLGNALETIGEDAFDLNFRLAGRIIFPKSMTSIGDTAFRASHGVDTFTFTSPTPPPSSIGSLAFSGFNPRLVLQVPKGSLDAYRAAFPAGTSSRDYYISILVEME